MKDMHMNAFAHRADSAPKEVISVFSVKFTRKFSKTQKAKARAKLAKALRKQGILSQYTGNIWLTLSLGKHTEKQASALRMGTRKSRTKAISR